jgi:hypothetical protein
MEQRQRHIAQSQALEEESAQAYGQFVNALDSKHEAAQRRKKLEQDKVVAREKGKAIRRETQVKAANKNKIKQEKQEEQRTKKLAEAKAAEAERKVRLAQQRKKAENAEKLEKNRAAREKHRLAQQRREKALADTKGKMGFVPKASLPSPARPAGPRSSKASPHRTGLYNL